MATLTLDEIVVKAQSHKASPEERRQQRVSLIMGVRRSDSKLTREDVSELLTDIEGAETVSTYRRVG